MHRLILRAVCALALVGLAAPAGAQEALPAHAGIHILTLGPGGELLCDEATEAQVARLQATAARGGEPLRLTPLASLNKAGVSDFRIILRATDQLLARPEALLAFRRSAARWERILQDDVTTVIDVDYGPNRFGTGAWPANVLGSTNSALFYAGNSTGAANMQGRLVARASSEADRALYEAIPVPTPSTSTSGPLGRGIGGLIPLQVLGYQPAVISETAPFGDVPSIGFNDAFAYDFDPTDGVDANKTDFEGVAIHEIGHALGFSSAIGISVGGGADPVFTPWDLFRVRPDAVAPGESYTDGAGWEVAERVVTPGPPNTEVLVVEGGQTYYEAVQVFFDGAAEVETSTATGSRTGGDGQQASHWRDDALRPPSLGAERKIGIMDPNLGRGSRDEITEADIRMLDVIGYTVDFTPPVATVALSVAGQAIDDRFLVETPVDLGDVPTSGVYEVPVVIGNESATTPLAYTLEVALTDIFPAEATPAFSFSVTGGSVAAGGSETVQFRIEASEQAVGAGLIRLVANDDDRAVIEVPFEFTTGGARAPELVVSGVPASLGDLEPGARTTTTATLANGGTFDLEYRVLATLATRGFEVQASAARAAAAVFSADFEGASPLDAFIYNEFATPDRWQTRTTGPAALAGHSTPTALYYGAVNGDTYSDQSLGQIETQPLDFSAVPEGRRVTLSFATYLQAEAGYDYASVLLSLDGGASYEEIATSDGGVLRNTDEWETVTIEVPGLAGFPDPVRVAFRFESDASVTDAGWYLDDIVVDVSDEEAAFFVSPAAGVIAGEGSVDLTLTTNAANLATGFYRASLEFQTNQPDPDPLPFEVDFSVGNPALPAIATAEPGAVVFEVPGGSDAQEVSLALRNEGDATLSFVRVLEPAASQFGAGARLGSPAALGRVPAGTVLPAEEPVAEATAEAPAARVAADEVLAEISFGTAALLYDVAQLGDGRIAVVDGGSTSTTTITVLPRDLSAVEAVFTSTTLGQFVTGLAYNTQTESLWLAGFQNAELIEVALADGQIVPTGVVTALDATPFGMDYAPELDAFLIGGYATDGLLAVTADGELLTGYPAFVDGRADLNVATSLPGVSFTAGLLEISGRQSERLERGQFGADFSGAGATTFSPDVLGGSSGVYGMLRDRLDPDGSFYVTTRPSGTVPARLVRTDPPNLPASVGTRVLAAAPLFADRSVEPRAEFAAALRLDLAGLDQGDVPDELVFLTNNPDAPITRIPLTIRVMAVAAEATADGAFALSAARPNPARDGARLAVTLAAPAEVTAAVFDALGRRVAVLAAGAALAAGTHELDVPTASLAPGLYVVRVAAGDAVATRKLTVIR